MESKYLNLFCTIQPVFIQIDAESKGTFGAHCIVRLYRIPKVVGLPPENVSQRLLGYTDCVRVLSIWSLVAQVVPTSVCEHHGSRVSFVQIEHAL